MKYTGKTYFGVEIFMGEIYKACDILSNEFIQVVHDKLKVESIWEKFKTYEFIWQWTVIYRQKNLRKKSIPWFGTSKMHLRGKAAYTDTWKQSNGQNF